MTSTLHVSQKGTGLPDTDAVAPKPIARRSEQVIEFRQGGGGLAVIGSPFFGAGLFMFAIAFGVIPMDGGGQWWAPIMMSAFATVFTSVGAVLVFGRTWTIVDRSANTITKAKGLLRPMTSERFDLRGYSVVLLQFVAGDSDSADVYPVLLRAEGGKTMELSRPVDFGLAYRQAAYVAQFLGWSLEDATSDHVRRVEATGLNQGVRERLRDDTEQREYVAQPFDMRSRVERLNGELTITVPARPFRLWQALPALLPVGIVLYVAPEAKEFFDSSRTPHQVQLVAFCFVGFFFVVMPIYGIIKSILASTLGYTRLILTGGSLVLAKKEVWREKRKAMALADLVDIDYQSAAAQTASARRSAEERLKGRKPGAGPVTISPGMEKFLSLVNGLVKSKGITIKSRRGIQYFGAGLPDAELAFLAHTMRDWLRTR